MPLMPLAASAEPLSCTPPSVAALKPAACIAAKSVEVYLKMPRVPDAGPGTGLGDGVGLGDAEGVGLGLGIGLGEGAGVGEGLGDGGGGADPVSSGRMSPFEALAAPPSRPA